MADNLDYMLTIDCYSTNKLLSLGLQLYYCAKRMNTDIIQKKNMIEHCGCNVQNADLQQNVDINTEMGK